jgi:hypothetical protein
MDKPRPSLFRIIRNDYAAFMAVILPIVLWGLFLFSVYQENINPNMTNLSIVITAAAIPLLIYRIFYIFKFFNTGEETTAVILGVSFYRSRGRADFSYTYQGAEYTSGNLLMSSGPVKQLSRGQEVVVLVNPDNPKKAVIRDLFI